MYFEVGDKVVYPQHGAAIVERREQRQVFGDTRKKEARMPTNWSRRYKNHVEKLKSGDVYQVAEVLNDALA